MKSYLEVSHCMANFDFSLRCIRLPPVKIIKYFKIKIEKFNCVSASNPPPAYLEKFVAYWL